MKKINHKIAGFGIALAAVALCAGTQQAQAQETADTEVGLLMTSSATITTTDPTQIEPTLTEILAGSVVKEDAFTLTVNSSDGSTVSVEGDDTGLLLSADIQLQATGVVSGSPVTVANGTPTTLYTNSARQNGDDVSVDITISNLANYAVSDTPYTNTLTFVVTAD